MGDKCMGQNVTGNVCGLVLGVTQDEKRAEPHSSVAEESSFLGYDVVLSGKRLPIFRKDRSALIFVVKQSKKRLFLDYLAVKTKRRQLLPKRQSVTSQKANLL
jgi:hypothetical protein